MQIDPERNYIEMKPDAGNKEIKSYSFNAVATGDLS